MISNFEWNNTKTVTEVWFKINFQKKAAGGTALYLVLKLWKFVDFNPYPADTESDEALPPV